MELAQLVEQEWQRRMAEIHREVGERVEQETRARVEQGQAQAKAEAILAVLAARGLTVSEAVRSEVLACRDMVQLDGWLKAAVTVPSAEAILAPGANPA